MGKPTNLPVPILGKWRKLLDSKDLYDVLGFFVQIPLQMLFVLGSMCLALQIVWQNIRRATDNTSTKPQIRVEEEIHRKKPSREFTLTELRKYDGVQTDKLYVAVNHKVFDVTCAGQFFGPGGPDFSLVGREASRTLVTLTSKPEEEIPKLDDFSDFTAIQLDYLFEIETQYCERYIYVGDLVEKKQPIPLYKSCIEVIRNTLHKRKNFGHDQINMLPLPKSLRKHIIG